MAQLILATNNPGKVRELSQLLDNKFTIVSQTELGIDDVPETGLSFVENALIKARPCQRAE